LYSLINPIELELLKLKMKILSFVILHFDMNLVFLQLAKVLIATKII